MPATIARPPRWERRKESRPTELIAAALALFVERGYAATRLDDVAARAGVSKGTLYLYFDSKQELFEAVVHERIVPLIDEFRRRFEHPDPIRDSAALLGECFDLWWQRFGTTELAGIAKLILAEAGNFPEVALFFATTVIEPSHALIESMIRRGIARGEFRAIDPRIAARICLAPLVQKSIWGCSFDPVVPVEVTIDAGRFLVAHTDMTLAALRAPPSGASPT